MLVTPPTSEPISVEDAKVHLRVTGYDEDALIDRCIAGARSRAEDYLRRAMSTQTWRYVQDEWSDLIRLPMAPLQSVTSVKYYDASGDQQTLATSVYLVDVFSEPGTIQLAPNQSWPALQPGRRSAVEVTYVVGYASVAAIPRAVLDGIYLLLTQGYERRGDDADRPAGALQHPAAEALLAPHRVFWAPSCV